MNLLILNYEYPPLGGGAGVVTKNHAEGLARSGHKVTVITTWFKTEQEISEINNLKIIRVKSRRKFTFKSDPLEMLSWMVHSKKILKQLCTLNKFDLCLAHFTIPGGSVAFWLKKRFKMPYYIFSHGHDIPWLFPKQMFFYHLLTYLKILKICLHSGKNIFHTADIKSIADKLTGERIPNKNIVISNGCDPMVFKPGFSIPGDEFKILFVGRLVNQKGPFAFLNSILKYSGRNRNFKAMIIGDGPCRRSMEKFVKKNNLEKIVFFSGWVPKANIVREYQSSSLLIAPSLFESMSLSLLEALFCGVYVITTLTGGSKELITDGVNGEITDFDNTDKIAEIIDNFYNNKFLRKVNIPEDFLESFRKKYEWESIIRIINREIIGNN